MFEKLIKEKTQFILLILTIFQAALAYANTVDIQVSNDEVQICPDLYGIFFEDINYAADGGLYAEMVQNRSFQYSPLDNTGWDAFTGWKIEYRNGSRGSYVLSNANALHPNNPYYVELNCNAGRDGQAVVLVNSGFDGMVLKKGDFYDFSVFARQQPGRNLKLEVKLESKDGKLYGNAEISQLSNEWKQYSVKIQSNSDVPDAQLALLVKGNGYAYFDMISLFPEKTFKDRKNGLRADLAQVIADLEPKFIRFPGGCLVHGDGLPNLYRWKDTIGPVHERKEQNNIWRYHQTVGLGYFEYFQYCEDIGAKPLPVVAAGVSCQNSGRYWGTGQQAIPMDEMDEYVQEVLDLIEWANGPASSKWGAKRAAAGHPEPFHLQYLGLGNEDVISTEFKVRYKMINDAIKAKYPDIVVIGTTGPGTDGVDYEEGWKFARQEKIPMVDEHGYKSPSWFWSNLQRFDMYQRPGTKVYLGEYAAHESNRANTLRSALSEAAYMTSLERNGDIVHLSSYAPLLAKQGHTQWRPDMIYFDNQTVTPSINYYAQQLFSVNSGDAYLPTNIKVDTSTSNVNGSGVMLGSWDTQVQYDDVRVASDGENIVFDSYSERNSKWKVQGGRWQVKDGVYCQDSSETPALSMLPGSKASSDYTLSLKAKKTGGNEGFIICFGVLDENNYYWLNLGGWNNTAHRLEKYIEGSQSNLSPSITGKIESNRWYDIKIQVKNNHILCYLDGSLVIEAIDTRGFEQLPDIAASTVRDNESGDIILKLVSKSDRVLNASIDLRKLGLFKNKAACTVLTGKPEAVNNFGREPEVLPVESEIEVSNKFIYCIPSHSVSIIRLSRNQ